MPQDVVAKTAARAAPKRNISLIRRMAGEKIAMLTEGTGMDEATFNALAEAELARIEARLEACGVDLDLEMKPGGVLEVEFDNGSKLIINRHSAAREIWLAAKSGGYHFQPQNGVWIAGRDGAELYATLARAVAEQSGMADVRL